MKHGKHPKNLLHLNHNSMSFKKLIKNSVLCHLPFLKYFGRHKHSFARFFGVFPGCHGNQVPFLFFFHVFATYNYISVASKHIS